MELSRDNEVSSYQSSGIGATETINSDWGLDVLSRGRSGGGGGVCAHRGLGERPLRSCSSERAKGLSGQHDGGEREDWLVELKGY
jgi:hypothetical protein